MAKCDSADGQPASWGGLTKCVKKFDITEKDIKNGVRFFPN